MREGTGAERMKGRGGSCTIIKMAYTLYPPAVIQENLSRLVLEQIPLDARRHHVQELSQQVEVQSGYRRNLEDRDNASVA